MEREHTQEEEEDRKNQDRKEGREMGKKEERDWNRAEMVRRQRCRKGINEEHVRREGGE
jgi:hypothetical protein